MEQRTAEVSEGLARRVEQQKAEAKKRKKQPKHRPNVEAFKVAVDGMWLDRKIFQRTDDAAALVRYAQNCHLLPGKQDWEYSLILVMAAIRKMGYKVESVKTRVKNKQVRYYVIHNG